jgi:hypothetical protein
MNGKSIELKFAGPAATSVITQTAEKVSISCLEFEVKAQQSVSISGAQISFEGQAQIQAKAPQVEIKSDATMSLESVGLATLKGALTNVQGNLVTLG